MVLTVSIFKNEMKIMLANYSATIKTTFLIRVKSSTSLTPHLTRDNI